MIKCWKCGADTKGLAFCGFCSSNGFATPIKFGKYIVMSRLGAGAFGTVYKCQDPHFDRFVAVKKLNQGAHASTGELARIRKTGRLSSPYIVQIHEIEPDDGYIVMEYVSGGTLSDRMKSDIDWVRDNFYQLSLGICEALRCAHSGNIIHRDIKPDNVLLTSDGRPKVADFGLCAALDSITHTRTVAGTVPYMAPEVLTGQPYSYEADVHSFGCMIYQIWAGRLPWSGHGAVSYAAMKANQVPAPLSQMTQVPEVLSDLVERMLATGPRRIGRIDLVEQQLLSLTPGEDGWPSTIDEMSAFLLRIYGYANTNKTPDELLGQYLISIRAASNQALRSDPDPIVLRQLLVRSFAWLCAFLTSINMRPGELIDLKYANGCPYCLTTPCSCSSEFSVGSVGRNQDLLARMRDSWTDNGSFGRVSYSFKEYQLRFKRLFGHRNDASGRERVILHTYAEIAEALDALLHLDPADTDMLLVLHLEASDLLAWFFAFVTSCDDDFDFREEFVKLFQNGCYVCSRSCCVCERPLGYEDWRAALFGFPGRGVRV